MSGTDQVRTFTVTEEDDGIRLDRWFRRNLPEASFGTVARWARTGQLRLDGKRAAPGDRIESGQTIRVPPLDETAVAAPASRQSRRELLTEDEIDFVRAMVIESDPAAIVVNKPPGLATQGGTKTNVHLDRLLAAWSTRSTTPQAGHRLDKDTSESCCWRGHRRAAAFFSKPFPVRRRESLLALSPGVPSLPME